MLASIRGPVLSCLGVFLLAGSTLAQDCYDWTETLQVAAPIQLLVDPVDVVVADRHALVVAGTVLTIYDLADPGAPALRGSVPLGGAGTAVVANAGLAAVAVGDHVLLVDWQIPSAPTAVADLPLPAAVTALDLSGTRLGVGCGLAGLHLFEVSVPGAPVAGGSLAVADEILDVSSSEDLLLLATDPQIIVVDVADLAAPVTVDEWSAGPEPQYRRVAHLGDRVAVLGSMAFWIDDGYGGQIQVRYSMLFNLVLDTGGVLVPISYLYIHGDELAFAGTTAYLAADDGVHCIDVPISGPPVLVATMPEMDDGAAIAAGPDRVLVARPAHVEVLDTTYPGFVPALLTWEDADATQIEGQFLLRVNWQAQGNWVTWSCKLDDLSTPGELTEIFTAVNGGLQDYRQFSIVRAWPGRLLLRSTTAQSQPLTTTYFDVRSGTPVRYDFAFGITVHDAHASGNRLYVRYEDRIAVHDASQPAMLPEIGSLAGVWGTPWEVADGDPSQVLVTRSGELVILDWTDPAAPVEVGVCAISLLNMLIEVDDGRAYLIGGNDHLVCVDITDPAVPAIRWTSPSGEWSTLDAEGGIGLVATQFGLQFVDLAGAAGPEYLGSPFGTDDAWAEFDWVDDVVYTNDDQVLRAWAVIDPTAPTAPTYLGRVGELGSGVSWFDNQVATRRGTYPLHCAVTAIDDPVVDEDLPPVPGYALRVAPNPFNPQTTVAFEVASAGPVRLALYDLTGRRVRLLIDEQRSAGPHAVIWDGRDDRGRAQASGVYIARLETERRVMSTKAVLVR